MPAYGTITPAPVMLLDSQVSPFSAEVVTAGEASQQYAIIRGFTLAEAGQAGLPYIHVEILFSAAPGAFQIDVQQADTDNAGNYVTVASLTSVDANQVGYLDIQLAARYVRLHVTSITNTVNTTATIRQR